MVCISGCDSAIIVYSHVFVMPFHITHGMTLFALLYSIFFVTVFGLVMWYVGVQKLGRHIRWYICI